MNERTVPLAAETLASSRNTRSLVLAFALATLPTGCIFVAPPAPGDITFLWSFDGEPDCNEARVDEVDVYVKNASGSTVREELALSCLGGGLTLEDFEPGTYTVEVEAYSRRGVLLFVGEESVTVTSGAVADIGVLELGRAGMTTQGDIAFYWSFDGTGVCETAGVDEVDVELVDGTGTTVLAVTEDCYGEGLILHDLDPGDYTLYIDAFASDDTYLFAGQEDVTVIAGQTTDIGTVELLPVDLVTEGTLRLDIGFLYPAGMAETDCQTAGVAEVDIAFIDENGAYLNGYTVDCDGDGIGLDVPLEAGAHTFYLEAYGTYMGTDVLLYDTADIDVTISADAVTDLMLVELERVSASFSDVRIEHTLPASQTCATLGLGTLDFTITRLVTGGEIVDDSGTYNCTDLFLLRETFVPGSYRVDVEGTGTAGNYIGTVTFNVGPNQEGAADVELVLAP